MEHSPLKGAINSSSKLPLLIVDKKGLVGKSLARTLRSDYLVVLVTAEDVEMHENVIHIPYTRKIPVIPDNTYSHLFIVYNGEKEMLEMLPSFTQKAQASSAKLLFVSPLAHSNERLFDRLKQHYVSRMQVLFYGETFANRKTEENEINFFIHQARIYGRITIQNSGLEKVYPVYFDDVISALITVGLGEVQQAQLFYIFPKHPTTQISFAHMLQKQDPLIKIDFKKHKVQKKDYYIPEGGIYLYPEYDLSAKLKHIGMKRHGDIPSLPQHKEELPMPDPEAKKRRSLIFLTLLFSLFIAPIILTFLLAVSATGFLGLSIKQAEDGNFVQAQQTASLAKVSFSATEMLIPGLVLPAIFFPTQTDSVLQNIHTGREVVEAEQDTLHALTLLQSIYDKKSLDPKNDFLKALATLKNTLLTFQKMKAESKLPAPVVEKMEKYTGVLRLVEGTVDTWPTLFGFEGKKTYLVLFQNNMELRPGGGFIGSYGILPVENGRMEKLQIYDVYDADGKLKTHVEPPFGLRRYLGASHWYLRDSNYDVDFSKNAAQAVQFLTMETGQSVDGVIAIDTTFLKNLLTVLGPVEVKDYKETVTADNFYLLTQTHAEKDFFPGSTQKKDFLRSLTNAMQAKLFEEKKFAYDKLLAQIEQSLRQKHLLFSFSNPGIQNVFAVNGLSSSLRDGRAKTENTVLDFFSVVDANVGANKANYYVKRSMRQDIRFDNAGALQTTAQVVYKNTSGKGSPYGGDYKNYVRFLLPHDAIVQHIFIDKQEQVVTPAILNPQIFTDKAFIPPAALEVEETQVGERKIVGFFLNVPVGQTKTITMSYRIPKGVNLDQSAFTYKLRLFKQPGTLDDPYTLLFSYPSTFKIVNSPQGLTDLGGKFAYEVALIEDKDFSVGFSKK